MSEPLVSVCILSGRRSPQLEAFLESLAAQERPPPFELLVCSDGDQEVAPAVHAWFGDATVGTVEGANLGEARNFLVDRSRGELLLFCDDDIVLQPHTLRRLADVAAAHPEAAVLGGPNETPPGSSRFERVQGEVLATVVGAGPVRRRYGAYPPGPADERFFTLCNLAVRRRAMLPFPPDLVGGEENALLDEMSRAGLKMHYDPELSSFHERRPGLGEFARQMVKYGRGRGQLARRVPRTLRPAYVVPTILVAYLLAAPLLALISLAALAPLLAYAVVLAAGTFAVAARSRSAGAAPLAALLILIVHLGYGLGVAWGLMRRSPRPRPEPEWVDYRPTREAAVAEAEPTSSRLLMASGDRRADTEARR